MQLSFDIILVAIGIIAFFILSFFFMFSKFYRKVEQGYVLIVNSLRNEPEVITTGRMVYPIIHKAELLDISVKKIEISRTGSEGLICGDNIRADIKVSFFVKVNQDPKKVLQVAKGIGCARASNVETLRELYSAKFSEALKTAGKGTDFVDLYRDRVGFREKIRGQIGEDLSGYELADVAIDYLEQTPLNKLDANNILDAEGIKKITDITTKERVNTNELERNGEMRIKKKDVETREAILELDRQQKEAEFKQQREIATRQAREEAEAKVIQSQENTKAETARQDFEQTVAVRKIEVAREAEVAELNKKRVVVIESEKVNSAHQMAIVKREGEVELERIDRDRLIEIQKKSIADVVRERVAVERTVAEQEEATKDVRVVAEADRSKRAIVIAAEADADEKYIKTTKDAEASERRAHFKAAEEVTLAEARLKVAEKAAEAKKREAEGVEAIGAAPGLAGARVRIAAAEAEEKYGRAEAEILQAKLQAQAEGKEKQGMADARVKLAAAEATEKYGRAEADVLQAQMLAEAEGKEKQGMADARVKLAAAEATEKYGRAEADVLQAKMLAEAEGKEKLGMAAVNVRSADAGATVHVGAAEAGAIEARLLAESKGLREKFDAMKAMSEETRGHEEFRMQLERSHIENLKSIEVQVDIASRQAEVLGSAVSKARIDIVGGDGAFFDRFAKALSVGKSIDGLVGKSDVLKTALRDQLAGKRNVFDDLQGVLGALGESSSNAQNLSLAALCARIAKSGTSVQKAALQTLLGTSGE